MSTRSYRSSSSIAIDGIGNTPCSRASISSNQDSPYVVDRFVSHGHNSKDHRLKRAAAQERRQATRKCWSCG
jgi:hypothetical protein